RRGLWAAARATGRFFGGWRKGSEPGRAANTAVEEIQDRVEEVLVTPVPEAQPTALPPEEVFKVVEDVVYTLRTLFAEISRAPNAAQREIVLRKMVRQAEDLKKIATGPE